ncbi:MAG: dihydrofolate reductase family protein, partial [Chloroflexi bacterium]|nr:dihydrofolate reductase family protein [Chloroflexota bacterium]
GQAALEAAGIKTVVGEGAEEAYEVAEAHIKVMTTNLPFVTAKFAMSREKEQSLRKLGLEVLRLPSRQRRVALEGLLEALRKRLCTHVLIEGGGAVLGAAFDRRLVDKVVVFIAPMIIGGKQATGPVGGRGVARIQEALRLNRERVQRIGDDVVVTGYMRKGGA